MVRYESYKASCVTGQKQYANGTLAIIIVYLISFGKHVKDSVRNRRMVFERFGGQSDIFPFFFSGCGNFGELRLGKNLYNNEHVAIKLVSESFVFRFLDFCTILNIVFLL